MENQKHYHRYGRIPRFWMTVMALIFANFVVLTYHVSILKPYPANLLVLQSADLLLTTSKQIALPKQIQSTQQGLTKLNGYQLADRVRKKCGPTAEFYPHEANEDFWISRMHLIPNDNGLYCPVEKVGTTFWRRFIYQTLNTNKFRHLYQVPIWLALSENYPYPSKGATRQNISEYFKFMFVRDPYQRIFSAYVDKVFVPNPMFWERFGKPSIQLFRENDTRRCFHDASFLEFVRFATWAEENKQMLDQHFMMATELCIPCITNYTFIGKMESFGEDSTVIFNKFSKISYTTEIKKRMKDLASLDAIVDSINSPFEWKQDILKCMTWYEALKRIWRKLQIRGLIDVNYPLPLDATASENVDVKRFTKLATEAHRKSDQKVLNSQKRALFIELYRMVPVEDLKKLSAAFERDFYIFDYNSMPHELFNRS